MHPQVLFKNLHPDRIATLEEYRASGGYQALSDMIAHRTPAEVREIVLDAALLGRGGAAFPAGRKMATIAENAPFPPYVVCNADEMEPGTFKDRMLLEQLPHQLIESMILAAWTIQATRGYIFLRGEYVLAAERVQRALGEARERGYLGADSLGTGWNFELFLHTGAGRYICGEETALINSLVGRRANPRAKPPFPQIAGAWGRPTIVNNVETLYNDEFVPT